MMNLTAESLRLRWRLPWARTSTAGRETRKVGQADAVPKTELCQKAGTEKGADVLEEIWHTADRERRKTNLAICSGLLRKFRAALAAMRADVFGACLCCNATLGLTRMTATPWMALCTQCQEAVNRDDSEILRIRSRG
jgi:RNA polymerase-binding transcription factor DksA